MKEFKVLGSRCWLAEVAPADLGVYVPDHLALAVAAAQTTGARLVVSGTYFDPATGKLCGLLRGGGRAWGWQPAGRPLLSVTGGRARVLPAAAEDPGADLVVGGGPVLVAGGRPAWRESYRQGRYTGLQPDKALPRVALGLTAGGAVVVVLVVEALTLQALAETLASQACADGMALDGGASAGLVSEGQLMFGGRRPLPSFVTVRAPARRLNDIPVSKDFRVYEFESPDTREVMIAPELVERLQALRDRLARPVMVTSGYRTEAHNLAVGGAPDSRHRKGEASDIKVPGLTPDAVARAAEEVGFRGIGVYLEHTHVDVRPGPVERWRG